jgi:hypothetical protein
MVNWCFGDSFDLYAVPADAVAGYWDSGTFAFSLGAGRFTGSRGALYAAPGVWLVKSSGSNDSIHHINVAFMNGAALTGTTVSNYMSLGDGATAQCTIVFRSDGAILLTSGGPAGATLATYTGATVAQNTWYGYEIEVIVNNTTGAFRVRKNGNTANDFDSGAVLNTRAGTTNNYANRLTLGFTQNPGTGGTTLDDLLWRSDTTSVPWVGDIRCYARMPQTDVSAQFARSNINQNQIVTTGGLTAGITANHAVYVAFTAVASGAFTILNANAGTGGGTARIRAAFFTDNAGVPGTVIGSSNEIVNPVAGLQNFTFPSAQTVVKGTRYWIGFNVNTTINWGVINTTGVSNTQTYATWPTDNPSTTASANNVPLFTIVIVLTNNADQVSEAQQDALTSYVYDSTVNDQDFYNLVPLLPTPVSTVAVTVRGFMEKSDAGARSGAMQLRSGATTVITPTLVLSSSFLWSFQTYQNDPNTTLPWTATGVDNLNLGPRMVA